MQIIGVLWQIQFIFKFLSFIFVLGMISYIIWKPLE